jgi:tetratricopeptide (TPR) repeat protein
MRRVSLLLLFVLLFAASTISGQTTAEDYYKRGQEKFSQQKYNEAIADYSKAIELDPAYVYAYVFRGSSRNVLKDYDAAIEDVTKAIELDPKYYLAWSVRANAKYGKKDFEGAIADFSSSIEVFPKDENRLMLGNVYYRRGITYLAMNKFDSAIADLTKEIEIQPKFGGAYKYRAEAYEKIGEKAKADRKKAEELGAK